MLPLIINTSLAKGALAMAREISIVKSLSAIRVMGSMDILCIDKTWTLTMNHAIMVNHLDSWDRGEITAFSAEHHHRILTVVAELSNEGLRETSEQNMENDDVIESDMVFLGVITFFDTPKDLAKQALWQLDEKGVKAKILTSDSLSLAIKICQEVGIKTTQKLRVVQSLQTDGNHVVGFMGDGINDSLALDATNVGISVDSAASVVKDLADIILLEKDINVLVAGVEQGRLTFGNTMKYIKLSNFLYSVGQISIPWDKMEEDYVKIPQKSSTKGLPMFILWNGPVCTVCDVANPFVYPDLPLDQDRENSILYGDCFMACDCLYSADFCRWNCNMSALCEY
ncbi:protein MIZU-KUSSEI 1-like [Hibiscus syriacus]|uniref:Protein MIZU-KUSSEI 1-like n=1 Tax=Hibiscus syriacus TaxID=106335 RepID=A0A6A3CEP3_HIBSY|nr:protein MIZU-KUSSEI 1-like [Hibiscus syriacus]